MFPKENFKQYLLLHLIVFIYGFTGILGRLITIEATQLVWYRLLIALVCLIVYFYTSGNKSLKYDRIALLKFLATGFVISLHWVFFYKSIKAAPVSIAVICLSSSAFFTSLIEPLLFKRKFRWYEFSLGIIVIAALGMIFSFNSEYSLGLFYGIISAFLAAVFPVLNGILGQNHNALIITIYEFIGGLVLLTLYLTFDNQLNAGFFLISMSDLFYLLVLGILCTAFTFVISIKIMKYISPYSVVLSINLEPVYTIIIALLVFKEARILHQGFYIGTAIILATIMLNAWLGAQQKKK